MIADKLLRVSENQAITSGTAVSTDTIDLESARDIGAGNESYMIFTVTEAFAGGTSVTFNIITSANADLSSNTVLTSSAAEVTADLVVGKQIALKIPPQIGANGSRYLGASYVAAGTHSAGEVTADVTLDIHDNKYYASGYTV